MGGPRINQAALRAASHSFFVKALLGQVEAMTLEEEPMPIPGGFGEEEKEEKKGGDLMDMDGEDEVAGWDIGEDDLDLQDQSEEFVDVAADVAGSSEAELWARNSPIAADHVAAGSFETAMQLLNRQVGVVDFAPLKPRFLEIYRASRTYLPAAPELPPLVNYVRRTVDETDLKKVLPILPRDLENIRSVELPKGFNAMKANDLEGGVEVFRGILHALMLTAVRDQKEVEEAQKIIRTATEYILAMSMELERRKIQNDDSQIKRNLELAAYFTKPLLERPHRQLTLLNAMRLAAKHKNFVHATHFADRVLANNSTGKNADLARNVKSKCERQTTNAVDIEYDQFAEFDICAASYMPIYAGQPFAQDPFTGAKYLPEYKGQVCRISQVTEIGAPASGLRLKA